MNNPIINESSQREAYITGWKEGALVKAMDSRINEYRAIGSGDFPLGSWLQQSTQGYRDGIAGLQPSFVEWKGGKL